MASSAQNLTRDGHPAAIEPTGTPLAVEVTSLEPEQGVRARLRRLVTRADGRSPIWIELLIALWLLVLYDEINDLAPLRRIEALHNGAGLLTLERSLHIAPELTLDRWVAAHNALGLVVSYDYVAAHFFVTFGLLAYVWRRNAREYRPLRNQLVIINLIGFAIFWLYPVAPPRMLASDGFRDVIALTGAVGDFHKGGLAKTADQYAAMPSLHIAWASWCAIVVWTVVKSRVARAAVTVYPFLTAFVVLSTGNHYLLDVLAGAVVAAAALAIEHAAARWIPVYRRRRYGLGDLRPRALVLTPQSSAGVSDAGASATTQAPG